jgi:predicted Zn-dependent peptidase
VRQIHTVTPADVRRIAETYLDPERMAIVIAGDRSVIEEQVAAIAEIVK